MRLLSPRCPFVFFASLMLSVDMAFYFLLGQRACQQHCPLLMEKGTSTVSKTSEPQDDKDANERYKK